MAQHATARRTAPIHPRRLSGPMRRPAPAVALPAPSLFERVRALPEHRLIDRLLRGRVCIWLIGVMLGGIVAMQVSLLRLNAGISRAVQTQDTLVRENADLESTVTELTGYDRVRAAAAKDNMIDPQAGDTPYVTARPGIDPGLALKRMRPPSPVAREVMANHGKLPGALATGSSVSGATYATSNTAASATGTSVATSAATGTATSGAVTPGATPSSVATPTATPPPAATGTPVPTATPPATGALQGSPATGTPVGQG